LENLEKSQEIYEKSLTTTEHRKMTGRAQLLDVLQIKTQLELLKPQIEQAKNQLQIAGNQLVYLMGQTEKEDFKLKGRLKTIYLENIRPKLKLENIQLPEYEVNRLQLEQLDYYRDTVFSKDYPNLKLVVDYLYNSYTKEDLFSANANSWVIQLILTIPLFSGFSTHDQNHEIASQKLQLGKNKSDIENMFYMNQVTSLKNLQSAEVSLKSAEKAEELAEASRLEAGRNYRLGTIDLLQFLTVEQSYLTAITSLNQLKYQSIVAYSNYFASTGQSMDVLVDLLND
jgi:outer membrane protein